MHLLSTLSFGMYFVLVFLPQPEVGTAKGGDYLCLHLRRKDYAYSRKDQIPSVKGAADQVAHKMRGEAEAKGLNSVFVATDAPEEEFQEFSSELKRMMAPEAEVRVARYEPTEERLRKFKDGGIAIVDQVICSHARWVVTRVPTRTTLIFCLKVET